MLKKSLKVISTPKGLEEIKNLQTELVVRYQYGLAPRISGGLLIDTFTYELTMVGKEKIASGKAT